MARRAEQGATHNLGCAEAIRLRRLRDTDARAEPPCQLIDEISEEIQRHCGHPPFKVRRLAHGWTVEGAVRAFHEMCRVEGLGARGLTTRSWMEWEAGGRPNADYQDLLCRLFRCGPVQLGFAKDYTPLSAQSQATRAPAPGTDDAMVAELRDTAAFARRVASSIMTEITLDHLHEEVNSLARHYVSQPLTELFLDIRDLRQHVFGLIEANRHPDQIRHLYLIASRVCGMQTHVALDRGNYLAADAQARTAWLCADLAGHNGARAWVRALQSLIAYWDGRLADAVDLAREGQRYPTTDSSSVRLPSLEARACAALGDHRKAIEALDAAEQTYNRISNDVEEPGGLFTFPAAKQAAYAGTTRLALRQPDQVEQAIIDSRRAIELYETGNAQDRSSGDLLAAHLDLASAHLIRNDLDGMRVELDIVLAAPAERRIASIRKRARRLATDVSQRRYRSSPLAARMREEIAAFARALPALPEADAGSSP